MKKIFIGWSGENKRIAEYLRDLLIKNGFDAMIGGGHNTTLFVGNQILAQMDQSDFAIFLLEKTSAGPNASVSANVMFEMGYLLCKLPQSNRIRVFLLNMNSSELPSDIAGCWSHRIEKPVCQSEEERAAVFESIAEQIFQHSLDYLTTTNTQLDKLDYLDEWNENKNLIYAYDGNSYIADKLLYGMQASVYSYETEQLQAAIGRILALPAVLGTDLGYIGKSVMAILEVFSVTKRLTRFPTAKQYNDLANELSIPYETRIKDPDLAAWCRIFRIDKLELCTEFYAYGLEGEQQIYYLQDAIRKCGECIRLIDEQVARNPADGNYALLFYAFSTRSLYFIYKKLYEAVGGAEYYQKQKEYCALSLRYRKELYDHYRLDRNKNGMTMDYVTQEYVLSLAEQHCFVEDEFDRREIEQTVSAIYQQWKEKNNIQNMIFNQITKAAESFLK